MVRNLDLLAQAVVSNKVAVTTTTARKARMVARSSLLHRMVAMITRALAAIHMVDLVAKNSPLMDVTIMSKALEISMVDLVVRSSLHMVVTTRKALETHMVDLVVKSNPPTDVAPTKRAPEIHMVDLAAKSNLHTDVTTTKRALETHTVDLLVKSNLPTDVATTKRVPETHTVDLAAKNNLHTEAATTKRVPETHTEVPADQVAETTKRLPTPHPKPRAHTANPDVRDVTKRVLTIPATRIVAQVVPAVKIPRKATVVDVGVTRKHRMEELVKVLMVDLVIALDGERMRVALMVVEMETRMVRLVVRRLQDVAVVGRKRLRRLLVDMVVVRRLVRVVDSVDMEGRRVRVIDSYAGRNFNEKLSCVEGRSDQARS